MRFFMVASGGGHWVQLMRISSVFPAGNTVYVSTLKGLREAYAIDRYHKVPDANASSRLRLAVLAMQMFVLLAWYRPKVVVSTGALPGLVAVFLGKKFFRAHTIWLDSVANAEELSEAGKAAGRYSDLWLTQWEELATEAGPRYFGSVL